MREIRQSGSEGGAAMSRPYPYQSGLRAERIAQIRSYFWNRVCAP